MKKSHKTLILTDSLPSGAHKNCEDEKLRHEFATHKNVQK